uniref:Secreted protein n=1 Tax=Panagrellus redivivus TaxID=6233 RepID=A0A7E4UNQ9_PANRE
MFFIAIAVLKGVGSRFCSNRRILPHSLAKSTLRESEPSVNPSSNFERCQMDPRTPLIEFRISHDSPDWHWQRRSTVISIRCGQQHGFWRQ